MWSPTTHDSNSKGAEGEAAEMSIVPVAGCLAILMHTAAAWAWILEQPEVEALLSDFGSDD